VASAVEPSVVAVTVSSQQGEGEGSGVILDKQGRIVTNNHVVTGAGQGASVKVTLSDGRTYDASVVGTDPATDLAVIKISSPPSDLTPATLGSSESAKVGDAVMAVGNPLGLAGTVTTGIISALDRPVTTSSSESADPTASSGEPVITNAIQTDAAVNPGNSGGALVDAQGRVIGIPSSIASLGSSSAFGQSSQSGSIGLGFAIPIDEVKDVTSQLIKNGTVRHSYLGVQLSNEDGTVTVNGASRDAAILAEITDGGPAAKAGLKQGDAIIAVDGEAVNGSSSLVGQLRQRMPGTAVKLTVVRNGSTQEITVTLGTRPASAG
jgi:putative serine protease PepD